MFYYFTSETPIIKGTCIAGSIVYFVTGSDVYTTTCTSQSTFTITIEDPSLPRDLVELEYYQKDSNGNQSSGRTLTLVIGVENFPEWLLIQLGISTGEGITPETEVNEEDLDGQNDNQDEVEDDMDEDNDLPRTGDKDDEDKDTRTEEEKDADRQKELVKDLLLCGIPLVLLFVILGAGFYFLGKPKKESESDKNTSSNSTPSNPL